MSFEKKSDKEKRSLLRHLNFLPFIRQHSNEHKENEKDTDPRKTFDGDSGIYSPSETRSFGMNLNRVSKKTLSNII